MTTDPKKNDEVKDEELDEVSGGTGKGDVDEEPDSDGGVPLSRPIAKGGRAPI